jgi:2-alkyl-3-oxoalkanoate reductase
MQDAAPLTVAVTGPSGFIGSRVVTALARSGARVRGLVRTPVDAPAYDAVAGDLGDATALARLVDGADVVVHAASYVGPDAELAAAVNERGTAAVVAAASAAGARVLQVSTAAVWGSGPHRGAPRAGGAPESPASTTRRAGELVVLAAGGTVVRPNLVHGAGDRWLFPGALRLVGAVGAVPDTAARASAVHVEDLGARIAAIVAAGTTGVARVHVDPPVRTADLVAAAFDASGVTAPPTVPVDAFVERASGLGLRPHHLAMLLEDAWFDGEDTSVEVDLRVDDADRAWYRGLAAGA